MFFEWFFFFLCFRCGFCVPACTCEVDFYRWTFGLTSMYLRLACTCELSIGTHEAWFAPVCTCTFGKNVSTCGACMYLWFVRVTDQVWFVLVCILVVRPLHVETYAYIYLWVSTMSYRFWKGSGFKPQCVASRLLLLCASTWQHWMLWRKKGWGETKMIGVPSRQTETASIFGFAFLHHPLAPMGGTHLHILNGS